MVIFEEKTADVTLVLHHNFLQHANTVYRQAYFLDMICMLQIFWGFEN